MADAIKCTVHPPEDGIIGSGPKVTKVPVPDTVPQGNFMRTQGRSSKVFNPADPDRIDIDRTRLGQILHENYRIRHLQDRSKVPLVTKTLRQASE